MTEPQDVLDYWFADLDRESARASDELVKFWFQGGEEVDAEIRKRFASAVQAAHAGELDSWADTPRERLALVILIDQFSRNVFRDDPRAYEADPKAQALVLDGMAKGFDEDYHLAERLFFYMPLEHAEERELQARAVAAMQGLREDAPESAHGHYDYLVDFALRHKKVVDRFGRFPHRNEVMGRESTAEELEFLDSDEAPF